MANIRIFHNQKPGNQKNKKSDLGVLATYSKCRKMNNNCNTFSLNILEEMSIDIPYENINPKLKEKKL